MQCPRSFSVQQSWSSANRFTKGVNHRAKRKGRFKARFTEGSDSAIGRDVGKAPDRQGRKSNCFSARKGCAEAVLAESAREEHVQGDADYQCLSWRQQALRCQ